MPANCTNSGTFKAETVDGKWLEGNELEMIFKQIGMGGKQYTVNRDTIVYEVKSTGTMAGNMSTNTVVSACKQAPKKAPKVKDLLKLAHSKDEAKKLMQ